MKKSFASSEEVYEYINSGEDGAGNNPLDLGIGARRNTSKKVVDFCFAAGRRLGHKEGTSGKPLTAKAAPKKVAGKTRPCKCGCSTEIPLSRKIAFLPGHKQRAQPSATAA